MIRKMRNEFAYKETQPIDFKVPKKEFRKLEDIFIYTHLCSSRSWELYYFLSRHFPNEPVFRPLNAVGFQINLPEKINPNKDYLFQDFNYSEKQATLPPELSKNLALMDKLFQKHFVTKTFSYKQFLEELSHGILHFLLPNDREIEWKSKLSRDKSLLLVNEVWKDIARLESSIEKLQDNKVMNIVSWKAGLDIPNRLKSLSVMFNNPEKFTRLSIKDDLLNLAESIELYALEYNEFKTSASDRSINYIHHVFLEALKSKPSLKEISELPCWDNKNPLFKSSTKKSVAKLFTYQIMSLVIPDDELKEFSTIRTTLSFFNNIPTDNLEPFYDKAFLWDLYYRIESQQNLQALNKVLTSSKASFFKQNDSTLKRLRSFQPCSFDKLADLDEM